MKKTLGTIICELRKKNNMTQLELAEKMNVTDKAVSKWERNLSCPDIGSLPRLAEVLGVSVEELMCGEKEAPRTVSLGKEIAQTALKGIAVAMGIAVTVLSLLGEMKTETAIPMLGIGLACMGISLLDSKK